jgi:hypothetical protein
LRKECPILSTTAYWHTNNQIKTTKKFQHAPKRHIQKKLIHSAFAVKQECQGGSAGHSSMASEAEPPSIPPSFSSSLLNTGTGIYPTQPHNQPETLRTIEQWVFIGLPCPVLDCSRGRQAAKRSRASAVTQWQRRSDDGGGEKRTSFTSFAHHKGEIIFDVGIR